MSNVSFCRWFDVFIICYLFDIFNYVPNICFLGFMHLFYWLIYLSTIFNWLQIIYFLHFSIFKFWTHLKIICCLDESWVLLDVVCIFFGHGEGTTNLSVLKLIFLQFSWTVLVLWIQIPESVGGTWWAYQLKCQGVFFPPRPLSGRGVQAAPPLRGRVLLSPSTAAVRILAFCEGPVLSWASFLRMVHKVMVLDSSIMEFYCNVIVLLSGIAELIVHRCLGDCSKWILKWCRFPTSLSPQPKQNKQYSPSISISPNMKT